MNGKEFAESLRLGRRVYGTLITSTSPHLPRNLRDTGLDFVFIDTEHIAIDDQELSWMCQLYHEMNLAPVVRIPRPDPYRACKVLDGGARGIIAPYVESAAEVRALIGAVKYRPLKGTKLAGILNGEEDPEEELESYLERRNADRSLIVNIESVPAIENLDEILAVPGLDAVLIGPHDLSCSLGIPEQYRHERFDRAVREILTKARAAGVGAGIHFWGDLEQEIEWARCGANLFLHSADVMLFTSALRSDLNRARRALGDEVNSSGAAAEAI